MLQMCRCRSGVMCAGALGGHSFLIVIVRTRSLKYRLSARSGSQPLWRRPTRGHNRNQLCGESGNGGPHGPSLRFGPRLRRWPPGGTSRSHDRCNSHREIRTLAAPLRCLRNSIFCRRHSLKQLFRVRVAKASSACKCDWS
jgi:hypothetical protein